MAAPPILMPPLTSPLLPSNPPGPSASSLSPEPGRGKQKRSGVDGGMGGSMKAHSSSDEASPISRALTCGSKNFRGVTGNGCRRLAAGQSPPGSREHSRASALDVPSSAARACSGIPLAAADYMSTRRRGAGGSSALPDGASAVHRQETRWHAKPEVRGEGPAQGH